MNSDQQQQNNHKGNDANGNNNNNQIFQFNQHHNIQIDGTNVSLNSNIQAAATSSSADFSYNTTNSNLNAKQEFQNDSNFEKNNNNNDQFDGFPDLTSTIPNNFFSNNKTTNNDDINDIFKDTVPFDSSQTYSQDDVFNYIDAVDPTIDIEINTTQEDVKIERQDRRDEGQSQQQQQKEEYSENVQNQNPDNGGDRAENSNSNNGNTGQQQSQQQQQPQHITQNISQNIYNTIQTNVHLPNQVKVEYHNNHHHTHTAHAPPYYQQQSTGANNTENSTNTNNQMAGQMVPVSVNSNISNNDQNPNNPMITGSGVVPPPAFHSSSSVGGMNNQSSQGLNNQNNVQGSVGSMSSAGLSMNVNNGGQPTAPYGQSSHSTMAPQPLYSRPTQFTASANNPALHWAAAAHHQQMMAAQMGFNPYYNPYMAKMQMAAGAHAMAMHHPHTMPHMMHAQHMAQVHAQVQAQQQQAQAVAQAQAIQAQQERVAQTKKQTSVVVNNPTNLIEPVQNMASRSEGNNSTTVQSQVSCAKKAPLPVTPHNSVPNVKNENVLPNENNPIENGNHLNVKIENRAEQDSITVPNQQQVQNQHQIIKNESNNLYMNIPQQQLNQSIHSNHSITSSQNSSFANIKSPLPGFQNLNSKSSATTVTVTATKAPSTNPQSFQNTQNNSLIIGDNYNLSNNQISSNTLQNQQPSKKSSSSRRNKQNPWKCNVCKIEILEQNKQEFLNHLETHKEERPFQCISCLKLFKKADKLKRHIKSVHKDTESALEALESCKQQHEFHKKKELELGKFEVGSNSNNDNNNSSNNANIITGNQSQNMRNTSETQIIGFPDKESFLEDASFVRDKGNLERPFPMVSNSQQKFETYQPYSKPDQTTVPNLQNGFWAQNQQQNPPNQGQFFHQNSFPNNAQNIGIRTQYSQHSVNEDNNTNNNEVNMGYNNNSNNYHHHPSQSILSGNIQGNAPLPPTSITASPNNLNNNNHHHHRHQSQQHPKPPTTNLISSTNAHQIRLKIQPNQKVLKTKAQQISEFIEYFSMPGLKNMTVFQSLAKTRAIMSLYDSRHKNLQLNKLDADCTEDDEVYPDNSEVYDLENYNRHEILYLDSSRYNNNNQSNNNKDNNKTTYGNNNKKEVIKVYPVRIPYACKLCRKRFGDNKCDNAIAELAEHLKTCYTQKNNINMMTNQTNFPLTQQLNELLNNCIIIRNLQVSELLENLKNPLRMESVNEDRKDRARYSIENKKLAKAEETERLQRVKMEKALERQNSRKSDRGNNDNENSNHSNSLSRSQKRPVPTEMRALGAQNMQPSQGKKIKFYNNNQQSQSQNQNSQNKVPLPTSNNEYNNSNNNNFQNPNSQITNKDNNNKSTIQPNAPVGSTNDTISHNFSNVSSSNNNGFSSPSSNYINTMNNNNDNQVHFWGFSYNSGPS